MILTHVIVYKKNPTFKQLKDFSKTINSEEIKNNGKIIAKCNLECDYKEIRKQIHEDLDCNYLNIMCTFKEAF